jgi:hypothetical protein
MLDQMRFLDVGGLQGRLGPVLDEHGHGLRAALPSRFHADADPIGVDRANTDPELVGNRLIGEALDGELDDFRFPIREVVERHE